MRHALWLSVTFGCAPVATLPADIAPAPARVPAAQDSLADQLPAGFGSLRQDEFSVEIVTGSLQLKVTPLGESVIRLAAPDTYERLRALAESRRADAERGSHEGSALFLVSFFSREPNVEYRPEEVQLTHRGRLLRPLVILPLTTGWGRQLLLPQQTQSAIYGFEAPFDYALPLTLRYGTRQTDAWHRSVLPRLEEERSRVLSRAGIIGGSRTP